MRNRGERAAGGGDDFKVVHTLLSGVLLGEAAREEAIGRPASEGHRMTSQ